MSKDQVEGFQLFITLPSGDVCSLRGNDYDSNIIDLKARVELKTGIPADIQHLYYTNHEMADNSSLRQNKLKHGSVVRVKLEKNWIHLFEACWRGDIFEVFQNGVQFLSPEQFPDYNITLWNELVVQRATFALFMACHRGFLGLIIELINNSACDIDGKTMFGRTALHVSAYQGFVGCVSLLLSEGATANKQDARGKTPLELASQNGHLYCEKRLWLFQWKMRANKGVAMGSRLNSARSEMTFNRDSKMHSRHEGNEKLQVQPRQLSRPSTASPRLAPRDNRNISSTGENTPSKDVHLFLPRVGHEEDEAKDERTKKTKEKDPKFPLLKTIKKYKKQLEIYEKKQAAKLPRTDTGNDNKQNNVRQDDFEVLPQMPSRENALRESTNGGDEVRMSLPTEEKQGYTLESQTTTSSNSVNDILPEDKVNEPVRGEGRGIEKTDEESEPMHLKGVEVKMEERRGSDLSRSSVGVNDEGTMEPHPQAGVPRIDVTEFTDGVAKDTSDSKESRPLSPHDAKRSLDIVINANLKRDHLNVPNGNDPSLDGEESDDSGNEDSNAIQEYMKRKSPQTFERWLEVKRKQNQGGRPTTAPPERLKKIGKSLEPGDFQKWLKQKQFERRTRTRSDSSAAGSRPSHIAGGIPYEEWLRRKRTHRSVSCPSSPVTQEKMSHETKRKTAVSGKSFEDWLAEKSKQQSCGNGDETHVHIHHGGKAVQENGNASRQDCDDGKEKEGEGEDVETSKELSKSEKAFMIWMQAKAKQKEIEMVYKATEEMEEERLRRMELINRFENPRVKTFQEWIDAKRHEKFAEKVQDYQCEKDKAPERDPQSSALMFDMWLTMKQVEELKDEEEKYKEMKEKWEKKKMEQEQMRMLQRQRKAKIFRSKSLNTTKPTKFSQQN